MDSSHLATIWPILAGAAAGLVLGFVGAGGTVVGLPILLLAAGFGEHTALGTNALGVAGVAGMLAGRSLLTGGAQWREGIVFSVPGLAGISLGAETGLVFPGQHLVFLLGFLLFGIAAWMIWLGMQDEPIPLSGASSDWSDTFRRAGRLAPFGFAVGWIAGFFAIGGGFLIVPSLMFAGELPLTLAAETALIPITLFAAVVGAEYTLAGQADLASAGWMTIAGIVAGVVGMTCARRAPRRWVHRVFALLLVVIGVYFLVR